jgi:hypothetical protein
MNLVSNAAVSIASGGIVSAIALSTVLFGTSPLIKKKHRLWVYNV